MRDDQIVVVTEQARRMNGVAYPLTFATCSGRRWSQKRRAIDGDEDQHVDAPENELLGVRCACMKPPGQ